MHKIESRSNRVNIKEEVVLSHTLSFFEMLEKGTISSVLSDLQDKNVNISSIVREMGESSIKNKTREVVSRFLFENEQKDDDVFLVDELEDFLDNKKCKKEKIISVYLASLSILSFLNNMKALDTESKVKNLDYVDYLSYIFFLLDLKETKAKLEEEESAKNFSAPKSIESILDEDIGFVFEKDFLDNLDNIAEDIFHEGLRDNSSSLFALKDLIENERPKYAAIDWGDNREEIDIMKSLHCKMINIEKIFYQ